MHLSRLAPAAILFAATLPPAAMAADTDAQSTTPCAQVKQVQGAAAKLDAVECAVKHVFQSRIRYRKPTEPVEMTVASPPMQSDDTGTPGANQWEVNVLATGEFAGDEHRIEAPLLDLNYGIGEDVQLKFELPYVFLAQRDAVADDGSIVRAHGVGDALLGLKYRFYDDKDNGLSFAVYPQVKFRTPGANKEVSDQKTTLIVPAIVTREFEQFSVTGNVGVEFADERHYFASAGFGTRLNDRVALMAELAGRDLNTSATQRVLLNLGWRWKLSDNQSLSGAVGRDVHAGGDQSKNTYVTFAFQQLIGK